MAVPVLPGKLFVSSQGDASTIRQRQESVERIGVLTGVRSGPWLLPKDDVNIVLATDKDTKKKTTVQRYWLLHWASLYEGLRKAVEADVRGENRVVQMSLVQGLSGCCLFHQRTPRYIREYIIDIGNEMNSETSATTFMQVLLSHDVVDAAWQRKKTQFGWSVGSESQSALDEKKLECATGLYPGRWKSYRQLEISGSFYRLMKSEKTTTSDNTQAWDALWTMCQNKIDFTHDAVNNKAQQVVQNLVQVGKLVKLGLVDVALEAFLLTMPVCAGVSLGKCPLVPESLPNQFRQLSDNNIKSVLASLEESVLAKQATAQAAAGEPDDEDNDDEALKTVVGESFIDDLGKLIEYLKKTSTRRVLITMAICRLPFMLACSVQWTSSLTRGPRRRRP
jgi:hypothetical protein